MSILSLCSGYGGLEQAIDQALGHQTIDAYCDNYKPARQCPQNTQPLDTHPQRRQRRSTPQLQKQHHRLRLPLPGPLQRRQTRRNQRHTQQPLLHLHERRTRRTTHRNHHRKRPPGRTLQGHHQPRAVGRRIQHRMGTRTSLRSRPATPPRQSIHLRTQNGTPRHQLP